jgi:hypothetical protein
MKACAHDDGRPTTVRRPMTDDRGRTTEDGGR